MGMVIITQQDIVMLLLNADTGDIDIKLTSEYSGWYGIGTQAPAYIEMRNATQGILYSPALITYGTFQGAYPNYTSELNSKSSITTTTTSWLYGFNFIEL